MKTLNVCFVGIGSIAKRHIGNLVDISKERNIELNIDCLRHVESSAEYPHIRNTYYSVEELSAHYDAVFITNPTSLHMEALEQFKNKSDNFFIEKPLCSREQYDAVGETLDKYKEKNIYVACPLRYTNVIQYIKNNVDFSSVNSIRSISSSYLPDWRPDADYRQTYSAHKNLGGGVSIDLIHEWDYIYYLIGKPDKVFSIIKKVSDLEIDSDDAALYIADYGNKTVEVHLDYFGRETIRRAEIFTADDTIIADITNSKVIYLKSGKTIDLSEGRNEFQKRELEYFLDILDGTAQSTNDLKKSLDVLRLAAGNQ